jgi:hypothetical protein
MITVKRIFSAILLVICLAVLVTAGAYLLVDDATLVALITDRLGSASGTRITYQKGAEITRTLSPTLSLKDLVIIDDNQQYQVHTGSLQVQITLPRLVLGQLDVPRLLIGETSVEIKKSDAGGVDKKTSLNLPVLPLQPVLHDVQISSLSISSNGETYTLPANHVRELILQREADDNTARLSVEVELAGQTIAITATLPDIDQATKTQRLSFSISAKGVGIDLSTEGMIDFNPDSPTVEASLHGHAPVLNQIPTGVKDFKIPGELTSQAKLTGTFDQLAVEDLSVNWKGPGQSTAELKGRINNVIDLEGIEVSLLGQLGKLPWLATILPDTVDTLNSADISAKVSGAYPRFEIREYSLKARTKDELDLSLSGTLDLAHSSAGLEPENIDLKLAFTAPTTHAARGLLFEEIPELGAITGKADIRAASGDPALENIVIQMKDAKGIEANISGSIGRFPLDPDKSNTGYDLDVAIKARHASVVAERLGTHLSSEGPLDLNHRIEGDTKSLHLKQINLSVGERKNIQVSATGEVLFGDWDEADPLKSIDLNLKANSQDTKALGKIFDLQFPSLTAVSAQARLHTVSGKHRVDDFRIWTSKNAPLKASLSGSAEHVTFLPKPAVTGIQLRAEATAADSARLNGVFGLKETIPTIGAFEASAQITGSDRELVVSDVSIEAGQKEILLVSAKGGLGNLSAANHWHPQDTDISINARSHSSSAFAKALGYRVPELGPLSAQASIHDKDKTLGLESAHIVIGDSNNPVVDASGFIDDLFGAGEIKYDVKLNLDGHTFATFSDNRQLPDLAPLTGNLLISNSDGTLGIDSLQLKSTGMQLLNLGVDGQFEDFKEPDTLSLTSKLTAKDLQLIGALFDREWPAVGPVHIDNQIRKAGESTELDTTLSADKLKIDAAISGNLTVRPMQLKGKITAQQFFLPELLEKIAEADKEEQPVEAHVFSRTPIDFEWLKKLDLDLSIDVESFDPDRSQIESAQFAITLKSGHLSISPAKLVYPKGNLQLDVQFDTQDPPQLSFKAIGEGINPWVAVDMQESKAQKEIHGDLDIEVRITTSGASVHDLVSNMEGDIYLTIQNGRIRKVLTDMVFVNLVGWSFSQVKREKYVDVDCGVADYTIKQGVISTNALYIDSKHIAVAGEGTIDLGNEQVDYVFLPKKKSRLVHTADPVHIEGPINNPSIKVLPWRSAMRTYGTLLFAPYIFAGMAGADYVSSFFKIGNKESPCVVYEKKHKEDLEKDGERSPP